MGIPELTGEGNLPEGEHDATLGEIAEQYSGSPKRRQIFRNLVTVIKWLKERGVCEIWIDGSFVSDKHRPGDVDVVYRPPDGVDIEEWDLLSPARRHDLKRHYQVDMLPYPSMQPGPLNSSAIVTIVGFFQVDRDKNKKGIIRLVD